MIVQGHLVDRKSRDSGGVFLSYHGCLSSDPDVAAVGANVNSRIDRLHRGVSKEWKFVFGSQPLCRTLEPGVDVAAFERVERCPHIGRFRDLGPDRGIAQLCVRSQIPIDIQCFDAGAGGPIMFADDCDSFVDLQDIDYARNLSRIGIVERFDLASVHGANLHGRGLHSVNRHVDPVDGASVHFRGRIDATLGRADDLEISGRLELRMFGYRQGRGQFRDISISQHASRR